MLLRELSPIELLLVLDDIHMAEHDVPLLGFLDEAAQRLPQVQIIVISRHRSAESWPGADYEVPLLTRSEIREFLTLLSVTPTPQLADTLHRWTRGIPQLVKLALSFVAERTTGEVRDTSGRLIRAYVATRGRSGDVAFFHNSVRDFVYVHLDPGSRKILHQRAAEWYRRKGATKQSTWARAPRHRSGILAST